MWARSSRPQRGIGGGSTVSTSFMHVRREIIDDSPLETIFETVTNPDGSFTLEAVGPESWLRLGVTAADGKAMRVKAEQDATNGISAMLTESGFVEATPDKRVRLVAIPAARVKGRVATKLPGMRVAELTVSYQGSRAPGGGNHIANLGAQNIPVGDDGRFVLDGLNEGTINVFVHGVGEGKDWTCRAADDVPLTSGETSEVVLEPIRGVAVEGTVVVQGAGTPIVDAGVGVYGPYRPRTGAMTQQAKTDAQGRFHYRLPPGATYLYVMAPPAGFTRLLGQGSDRTVKIPDGVDRFEVPPLELAPAVTLRGRVLDTAWRR